MKGCPVLFSGGCKALMSWPPFMRAELRKALLTAEGESNAKERRKPMTISPLAGKPAPKEMLVDPAQLEQEYYARRPDVGDPTQRVSFGTSGHRGSALHGSFTEAHILAITQAILNVAGSGKFSSDRTIAEYAADIWKVVSCPVA